MVPIDHFPNNWPEFIWLTSIVEAGLVFSLFGSCGDEAIQFSRIQSWSAENSFLVGRGMETRDWISRTMCIDCTKLVAPRRRPRMWWSLACEDQSDTLVANQPHCVIVIQLSRYHQRFQLIYVPFQWIRDVLFGNWEEIEGTLKGLM